MVNRPPAAEGHRMIWRAICDGLANGVDAGLADGLAEGLRQHLPGGIAILVKGTPLCMLSAFIHFVLDVALPVTAIALLLGAAGIGGIPPSCVPSAQLTASHTRSMARCLTTTLRARRRLIDVSRRSCLLAITINSAKGDACLLQHAPLHQSPGELCTAGEPRTAQGGSAVTHASQSISRLWLYFAGSSPA